MLTKGSSGTQGLGSDSAPGAERDGQGELPGDMPSSHGRGTHGSSRGTSLPSAHPPVTGAQASPLGPSHGLLEPFLWELGSVLPKRQSGLS